MGQEGGGKGQQSPSLSSSPLRDYRTCPSLTRKDGREGQGNLVMNLGGLTIHATAVMLSFTVSTDDGCLRLPIPLKPPPYAGDRRTRRAIKARQWGP